jgi:nicotinic acid mononucleotide adenylyltransferase
MTINAQTTLQKTNTKLLQGTWIIDTMYLETAHSDVTMALYAKRFKKLKETTTFVFTETGEYKKISSKKDKLGKWKINSNGKTIIINFNNSDEISQTSIRKLTDNKLIMVPLSKMAQNTKVELSKLKE